MFDSRRLHKRNDIADAVGQRTRSAWQKISIVVGAAGLLTLGGAGYFSLRALNRKHAYEALGDACRLDCQELRDAHDAGNIATILSIGGAALTTAGIVTYALSGGSAAGGGGVSAGGMANRVRLSPVYVAGSWHLVVDGRF